MYVYKYTSVSWGLVCLPCIGLHVCVSVLLSDYVHQESANGDTCLNMVTGMHWEILYANAGALGNPQAKIIGASYRYTSQTIRFQVRHMSVCHSELYSYHARQKSE